MCVLLVDAMLFASLSIIYAGIVSSEDEEGYSRPKRVKSVNCSSKFC